MVSSLIHQDAIALIGPVLSAQIRATHPICGGLHVPQIAPWATDPRLSIGNHYPYLLKMTPPDDVMNRAVIDLVSSFMWNRVSILTDDTDFGLNGVHEFIKLASRADVRISTMLSFHTVSDSSAIDATKQLQEIRAKGTTVVILHCHPVHALPVLRQAYEMGIFKSKWVWIVTSLARAPHLDNFDNITGLLGVRPAHGKGSLYKEFQAAMVAQMPERIADRQQNILASTAHGYDAILAIGYALHALLKHGPIHEQHVERTCTCESGAPSQCGEKLIKYLREARGPGATTEIAFNEFYYPENADFEVVNLKAKKSWVKDPPFVIKKNPADGGGLGGFCIDLIEELHRRLQFDYDIYIQGNDMYGTPVNGSALEWNGMVGDLLEKKADLAVAATFISKNRAAVIDFSVAYYDSGLSVIMRKEEAKEEYGIWPIIAPFDSALWLLVLGGTFATTLILYIIEFLSPYGQYGVHVQRHDRKDKRFRDTRYLMNIRNSFQFCYAAFVGLNIEGMPRSFSGRLIGNYWYLVVFFITAGYTANFAAFLTVSQMHDNSIQTLSELTAQNKIKYGTLADTNTAHFILTATNDVYGRMARHTMDFDTNVKTVSEAIRQLKSGFKGQEKVAVWKQKDAVRLHLRRAYSEKHSKS
ncbi:glutamate receptor ionotropic, kainate 1-like [Lineus longissimus]|uniref:glutamate receptor ionotropic, kainate 1-like n=1 Tax=Lineus longissimus TaxID=88925 RepID=UPI00315D16BE